MMIFWPIPKSLLKLWFNPDKSSFFYRTTFWFGDLAWQILQFGPNKYHIFLRWWTSFSQLSWYSPWVPRLDPHGIFWWKNHRLTNNNCVLITKNWWIWVGTPWTTNTNRDQSNSLGLLIKRQKMAAAQNTLKSWKIYLFTLKFKGQGELTNQFNSYVILCLHPPTEFIYQLGLDLWPA